MKFKSQLTHENGKETRKWVNVSSKTDVGKDQRVN